MIPIYQVDAFADKAFSGNPAGVCLLREPADDRWMQHVAAKMNLSETAFLVPQSKERYHLRWFTPSTEVDLCGHATLASAFVLYNSNMVGSTAEIAFDTRSGELTTTRNEDGSVSMDFPATPPEPADEKDVFDDACSADPVWTGTSPCGLFAEFESEDIIREMEPNTFSTARKALDIIVTAKAGMSSEYDFVSRYFAPGFGIPEDPVTGSVHCVLGPYWAARIGNNNLVGFQASSRGGPVRMSVFNSRVKLSGHAVLVFSGELHV